MQVKYNTGISLCSIFFPFLRAFPHAVVCFAFSSSTSVSSSSIVLPCCEKCSFTIMRVLPRTERCLAGAGFFSASACFSITLSITHTPFPSGFGAVRRLVSKPTGIAPLHGSHVAVPIACDAVSVQAVAVREYHYQTGQVMAGKGDKPFLWTRVWFAHLHGRL